MNMSFKFTENSRLTPNPKESIFTRMLLLVLLITGCTLQPATITSSADATNYGIPKTDDFHPTITLTPTFTLSPTSSPTVTRTVVSPTTTAKYIITPTPTPTPLPTLGSTELETLIGNLMKTNKDCTSSCFWGIIPDVSNANDSLAFMNLLAQSSGIKVEKHGDQYSNYYHYKENISIFLEIRVKNTLVAHVFARVDGLASSKLASHEWQAFRPDGILGQYGKPSRVTLSISEGPEGHITYYLRFYYDQVKFVIEYRSTRVVRNPDGFQVCPLADHGIESFDFWLGLYSNLSESNQMELKSVTALSLDQFYELMLGNPQKACFEFTPLISNRETNSKTDIRY